ncbi:prenyltransferase [Thermococcus sp. 21S7]|uniref:prenyltransferase n=1 Tax=Thermococcus sp. 21S7 TaxID=1638221 RepID=UPI00143873B7|nr:prenyltransferase [Thermococcus sp. 21S7]NJE62458.1 prenyltransferase [Thermococcus sp. 21S7]
MLINEVLASVEVIADPYVKSATYAKIGEKLANAKHGSYKDAFLRAVETAREIDDPFTMFKALLSVGYSMGRAGLKSAKRIYTTVMEESRVLPPIQRDSLMRRAAAYMLALGEVGEALTYAMEIKNRKLKNDLLLEIMRFNTRMIGNESLKAAYRLRKSKLILDYLDMEPHRSEGVRELIRAYLYLETYENAVSLLEEIGRKDVALQTFKEVVFYLKENGLLGHYIDSIETVARALVEKFGDEFTVELALALALVGEGVAAVRMVRELEDSPSILVRIALELLKRDHDVLPPFISALNEEEATLVGRELMNVILRNPRRDDWEVVEAVGKSTSSEEVWAKIARYYVLMGELEAAIRIGLLLKNGELRSVVMADVAHHLLKRGEVERAIDAALEVRNPRFSSILVSEILIKALEQELPGRVKSWNGSRH